jgi:tricorn protease
MHPLRSIAHALRVGSATVLLAAASIGPLQGQAPAPRPALGEPSLAPDRSEIAFVSGGDIWSVPAAGGEARLLVSHPATESRPLFSPDGKRLAFISTRTGGGDIYVLTFATGDLRRITHEDVLDQLDAWSPDGRWLYFTSNARDVAGMNDIYRVSADGGTPMLVSADRYANEYWAAPAPDGAAVAFTARGTTSGQWWRNGRSHLDETQIWVLRDAATMRYEQVTPLGAKNLWPMWAPDGRTLYFVSDRDGAQNIWRKAGTAEPQAVTHLPKGRVVWPSISADGKAIAFERDFGIWLLDTSSGSTREVPITLRGAAAGPSVEHLTLTSGFQDLALSPDGKKVAFVARGEVFAASSKDGGDAARVTATPAREQQLTWTPDSRSLIYVSSRDGAPHLFRYDFATRAESRLTNDPAGDVGPRVSPDGKLVAFARGGRRLMTVDLATRAEREVAAGTFDRLPLVSERAFVWSPDSRWLAYLDVTGKRYSNVNVVAATGGESRPVSFLANVFGNSVSWSPDGSYLLFDTSQRTEPGDIARVDLVPRLPRFREDQFRDLFRDEPRPSMPNPADRTTAPRPPSNRTEAPADTARADTTKAADRAPGGRGQPEIVFDGIRRRLAFLPTGLDAGAQRISPDGKTLLLTASAAGQQNLYLFPLDELARDPAVARQLTSTAGFKRDAQFTPDGKEVYFLEQGRIVIATVESRQTRPLAVTAELDVDFAQEKLQVFDEAWSYLRDNFADPTLNGVNWTATRAAYAPLVAGARTPDELRRILSFMVGELDASHSGVGAPGGGGGPTTGRVGLRFDRAEYERDGRLRITDVLPLSPAALGGVRTGEYLVAVEGRRTGARVNLDELLTGTVGRRVSLTIASDAAGTRTRDVAVKPVATATEKALGYRQWVEDRRAYVARASNNRLGYVHMADMGAGSLAQLFVDLDAENQARDGVVIDIRHNNGGFVNAYALDVFARRPYLTMTYRGDQAASPARTVLGQRTLESPTILVTDQHSLSDAEDFTEGYRTLGLGKVVGEPTAGWIIYTTNVTLIDGTSLRIPFITIRGADGQVMEGRPRAVDVPVERPIGESYTPRDSQLDAAVRELLKQLEAGKGRKAGS